jgi:putative salt-induced outer membrane protein YdiY
MRLISFASSVAAIVSTSAVALADPPAMGKPPADAAALVETPKALPDAPKMENSTNETTATISAGGQFASGNSKLIAATANGKFDMRRGANGFGAALLANYGQGAPPGETVQTTSQNVQGRLRYDRFLVENTSLFLIGTGRHDRFQGLDFRLNIDPGAKYLFVHTDPTAFWGELGYDFQYDIRRDDALQPADATLPPLSKTETDHSARVFIGFRHAFNKEVTFATGLEYLQSFVEGTRARLNYDALFAANVGGGLALGLGFSARYDHAPLPGKEKLDTATTVSLIYAFSDAPEAPPPAPEPAPAAAAAPPSAPAEPPPSASPPPAPAPVPAPAAAPEVVPPPAVPPPAPPAAPAGPAPGP